MVIVYLVFPLSFLSPFPQIHSQQKGYALNKWFLVWSFQDNYAFFCSAAASLVCQFVSFVIVLFVVVDEDDDYVVDIVSGGGGGVCVGWLVD